MLVRMSRVAAALLVVSLAGCGLTMTRGPDPRRPPDQRPTCTESFDAPKRDAFGALAGFGVLLLGVLFATAGDNDEVGVPLALGGAVVVAASYASGGVGYFRVKKCRAAVAAFEQAGGARVR